MKNKSNEKKTEPKCYKNNPFGELEMVYDFVKLKDLSKINHKEISDFFIEISDLKNNIIDYVKITNCEKDQLIYIIFMIKSLYEFIYKLLTPELFKEADNKLRELNDAFDFELEPKELKNNLLIENAESRILEAIDEVKRKAEKASNKSSKK